MLAPEARWRRPRPRRARYLLQRKIEEQAELAAGLSQLQELRHQTATDIIDSIR